MSEPQSVTLGQEDYQALFDMSTSPDPEIRAQASMVSAKLTKEEGQAFFDFQRNRPRGERQDTNILGIDHERVQQGIANWASSLHPRFQRSAAALLTFPADVLSSLAEMLSAPETVATGLPRVPTAPAVNAAKGAKDLAAPVVRGVSNAAIRTTAAAGDFVAPDVIGAISPRAGNVVKLAQLLRSKLPQPKGPIPQVRPAGPAPTLNDSLIGAMNEVRRAPTATSVSLPETGAVQAERTTARMLAEREATRKATPPASRAATPSAAPPAAATPGSAPSTPALTLTDEEAEAVRGLVAQGYDEADVLRELAKVRHTPPPQSPQPKPAQTTARPGLQPSESKEYTRLRKAGKTHQEAMQLIEEQRAMASRFGLPSSEQASQSVADRNVTGRWRDRE